MSTDTIIIHQEKETPSALPVRRVPMTLAVHADNPVPIAIPDHRRRTTPATRTAWPPPFDDHPCGNCGASAMMSRRYYFRGAVRLCLNCGWKSNRRIRRRPARGKRGGRQPVHASRTTPAHNTVDA